MKKKLLAGFMTGIFLLTNTGLLSQAANVVEVPAEQVDSVYNQGVESNGLTNWPAGPQIYSESGIVMDMYTGAILYAKNIDDQHYPASITKVMTALVALENCQMTDTVEFAQEDISFLEYGDAHIGMKVGEKISMEDAMYGMLLASANEVSHAIGRNTAGGYDNFINLMNQKAAELGCKNSHFVNTYGLHDAEHYTSARDMALIGSAVFKYETFRTITNTYEHVIGKTNITKQKRYVHQNHKMLRSWDSRYYKYCVGGKTGFTDQALTTLVTFATKGNMNLVAVTLRTHGGGNNAYRDTKAMLQYAFKNFKKTTVDVAQLGNENIAALGAQTDVTLPSSVTISGLESTFTEPTNLGDKEGTISYTYEGQPVGTVDVTITDKYYNQIHGIEEKKETVKKEDTKKKTGIPTILKVILTIVIILIVAMLFLVCLVSYRRKQLEKMRRERRRRRREEWERMKRE